MQASWSEIWSEIVAPHEPHKFERRLFWDGIDREILSSEEPPNFDPPRNDQLNWESALTDCREALKQGWETPILPYAENITRPFVDLWLPISCFGADRLKTRLQGMAGCDWIHSDVCDQLADRLLERICSLGDQPLWHIFNRENGPGMMLLAHLGASGDGCGPPLREHYERFICAHRQDGLEAFLGEFPVFGRLLGTVFTLWMQGSVEIHP